MDNINQSEMSISQYLQVARARKGVLLALVGGAFAIALLYTLQAPNVYTARTALNFDFQGSNPFLDKNALQQGAYLTTQIDIIKSKAVARRVAESLTEVEKAHVAAALEAGTAPISKVISAVRRFVTQPFSGNDVDPIDELLAEGGDIGNTADAQVTASSDAEKDDSSAGDTYAWLAGALPGGLTVQPLFGSRIVVLEYTSASPRVAAMLANAYAKTYIQANLDMMVEPAKRTKEWFAQQIADLRKQLEDAQNRMTAYQQSRGIVVSDERLDTENQRLNDLSTQLIQAQAERRQIQATIAQVEDLQRKGDSLFTFPAVFSDAGVQRVYAELQTLRAKLADQSSKLGDNHPQYKRTQSEIQEKNKSLSVAIQSVVGGLGNGVRLAQEKERAIESAFLAQKDLLLKLKNQRDEALVLQREVESAQSIYNAALTQLSQASLKSVVDQTNISVVDAAVSPGSPSGPNMLKNMAIGLLVGLVLGIGTIVFMELMDRRVRSREDISAALGLPLLGVLKRA